MVFSRRSITFYGSDTTNNNMKKWSRKGRVIRVHPARSSSSGGVLRDVLHSRQRTKSALPRYIRESALPTSPRSSYRPRPYCFALFIILYVFLLFFFLLDSRNERGEKRGEQNTKSNNKLYKALFSMTWRHGAGIRRVRDAVTGRIPR